MAMTRPGPAATAPSLRCGASDVHGVGWSIAGQLGWLVTAVKVASQFAAAAAASSTAAGAAARARNPASRRGSRTTRTTGSAMRTSGWTASAAPMSQADRPVRACDSARMPNRNSAAATASSGWPHRTETLHRATACAAARTARFGRLAPSRSAIASAANRAMADSATS
jgi:hypothetical protein